MRHFLLFLPAQALLFLLSAQAELGQIQGPVQAPAATVKPVAGPDQQDQILNDCMTQDKPASNSRQINSVENQSEVDAKFLEAIKQGALKSLSLMQSKGCENFEQQASQHTDEMRKLRACANAHIESEYNPKLWDNAGQSLSKPSPFEQVGFEFKCQGGSRIDRLANHHLSLLANSGLRSQGDNQVLWKPAEIEPWCDKFIKTFASDPGDLKPLLDQVARQRDDLKSKEYRPVGGENARSLLARKLEEKIHGFLESQKTKCIADADTLVQKNPLLKYVKTHPASPEELQKAKALCIKESETSKATIEKISTRPISQEALAMIFYSPLAAQAIQTNPEYCNAFGRLRNQFATQQKNRKLLDLALAGGTLVGCGAALLVPPVGAGCFLVMGGVSLGNAGIDVMTNLSHASTLKSGAPIGVDREALRHSADEASRAPLTLGAAAISAVPVGRFGLAAKEANAALQSRSTTVSVEQILAGREARAAANTEVRAAAKAEAEVPMFATKAPAPVVEATAVQKAAKLGDDVVVAVGATAHKETGRIVQVLDDGRVVVAFGPGNGVYKTTVARSQLGIVEKPATTGPSFQWFKSEAKTNSDIDRFLKEASDAEILAFAREYAPKGSALHSELQAGNVAAFRNLAQREGTRIDVGSRFIAPRTSEEARRLGLKAPEGDIVQFGSGRGGIQGFRYVAKDGAEVGKVEFKATNYSNVHVELYSVNPEFAGRQAGDLLLKQVVQRQPSTVSADLAYTNADSVRKALAAGKSCNEAVRTTPFFKSMARLGYTSVLSSSCMGQIEIMLGH